MVLSFESLAFYYWDAEWPCARQEAFRCALVEVKCMTAPSLSISVLILTSRWRCSAFPKDISVYMEILLVGSPKVSGS